MATEIGLKDYFVSSFGELVSSSFLLYCVYEKGKGSTHGRKMGNLGSSFPRNVGTWREIWIWGEICLSVHKKTHFIFWEIQLATREIKIFPALAGARAQDTLPL